MSKLHVRSALQCKKLRMMFLFCLFIAEDNAAIYLMLMQINPNACYADTDAAS